MTGLHERETIATVSVTHLEARTHLSPCCDRVYKRSTVCSLALDIALRVESRTTDAARGYRWKPGQIWLLLAQSSHECITMKVESDVPERGASLHCYKSVNYPWKRPG